MSRTSKTQEPRTGVREEDVLEYLQRSKRPLKLKEIARGLNVGDDRYPELKGVMAGLVAPYVKLELRITRRKVRWCPWGIGPTPYPEFSPVRVSGSRKPLRRRNR